MFWTGRNPIDTVEEALRSRGWKYQRIGSETLLTGVSQLGRQFMILFRDEDPKQTLLILFSPVVGDLLTILRDLESGSRPRPPLLMVHASAGHSDEQVAEVCRSLLHKNYEIALGRFERDDRDGEIRYSIAIPYRDTRVTVEQVNWCLEVGVATLYATVQEVERILGPSGMRV